MSRITSYNVCYTKLLRFIVLIGYLGSWLAVAPLLAVPLVILVGMGMQRKFQQEVSTAYREGNQKNALLFEAINGLETIKTSYNFV